MSVASEGGADADPIAVRIGEHSERWRQRVIDDGPARGDGGSDPFVGHLRSKPEIEVPTLARGWVVVGALEPDARDPAGGVKDRVVSLVPPNYR